MTNLEIPTKITAIESYLADRFKGTADNRIVKTKLSSNGARRQLLIRGRIFTADNLKIHLRNHTALADEMSPYVLTYFLGQEPISVFSRAPDHSEWR